MTSKFKGILATFAVFVVFAAIYFSTISAGICPWVSAHSVAAALGLESGVTQTSVRQVEVRGTGIIDADFRQEPQSTAVKIVSGEFRTRHLVWRSVVAFIARKLPYGSLAFRLNAFSALLGALTVALAFALCRGLILFINFHDSPVSSEGRKSAAFAAAVVTVLALGFSAPFWLAATRVNPAMFDAFLLVAMSWLLFSAVISQDTRDLFAFGVIWGISLFETDTGVFTGILLALFVVRAMLVGAMMTIRAWCNLLVGMIAGIVIYIIAAAFLLGATGPAVLQPFLDLFKSVGIGVSLVGGGIFSNQPMLVSVLFVVLPFAATCALAMWRDAERNAAAAGFLVFLLACTTAIALSRIPLSPWGAYGRAQRLFLPVVVSVLAAAIAGYLASFGAVLAGGHILPPPRRPRRVHGDAPRPSDDFNETSVGRIVFWFVFVLATICGLLNWREIRDGRDRLLAATAREFVARLGQRTWIASTTTELDTMLRIQAWEEHRPLHVISHGKGEADIRRLKIAIARDETFRHLDRQVLRDSLASTNLDSFVTAWVSIDPDAGKHLVLDDPTIWKSSGHTPVPDAIGYRPLAKDEKPDWNAIAENHVALWRALAAADSVLGPAAPGRLRAMRGDVRAYVCSIGENLAAQLGRMKEFPATRTREIIDRVEDLRTERRPAARDEIFY